MSLEHFEPQSSVGKALKDSMYRGRSSVSNATQGHRAENLEKRLEPRKAESTSMAQNKPRPAPAPHTYAPDPKAREKFCGLHEFLIENKLFLTDAYDMKFNCIKTYNINKNGSEKAVLAKESYCSQIIFSELVSIGFNLRGTKHNNTLLAQGDPGLGKTVLAEYCGQLINQESAEDIADSTIQCNPQQTAETMIASYDLPMLISGQKKVNRSSFVTQKTKILDEIQRLPPETFAIILQAIDSGKTKYGDEVIRLSEGPIYATKNAPDEGSSNIIPAGLDRFQVSVRYHEVNPNFLPALIEQGSKSRQPLNVPKELYIDTNTILTARNEIREVGFDKNAVRKLIFYIGEISGCNQASEELERKTKSNTQNKRPSDGLCTNCHYSKKLCSYFDNSISMRAIESTLSFAAGVAWFRNKKTVEEEDITEVLPRVLDHRAKITPYALEKKPVWDNDGIAFIRETYTEASQQFVKYQNSIPEFSKMLDDLDNPHTLAYSRNGNCKETIARLEGYFSSVIQKMDTVSKFSYAKILLFAIDHLMKNDSSNSRNSP